MLLFYPTTITQSPHGVVALELGVGALLAFNHSSARCQTPARCLQPYHGGSTGARPWAGGGGCFPLAFGFPPAQARR